MHYNVDYLFYRLGDVWRKLWYFVPYRMHGWRKTLRTLWCIGRETHTQRATTTSTHRHQPCICPTFREWNGSLSDCQWANCACSCMQLLCPLTQAPEFLNFSKLITNRKVFCKIFSSNITYLEVLHFCCTNPCWVLLLLWQFCLSVCSWHSVLVSELPHL